MSELRVLIDENEIGSIFQEKGRLRFVYDQEWRSLVDAVPLSLSMPLTSAEHPHKVVEAYLWNLLPDRETILQQVAREHGISPHNPFALAGARGEDLQGAVQIVPPNRIPHLRKRERIVRFSIARLPAAAIEVPTKCRKEGLDLTVISQIAKILRERCTSLQGSFQPR